MASLSIISKKGEDTVIPPPDNSFAISSEVADRCERIYKKVDSIAYFPDKSIDADIGGKTSTPAPPAPRDTWSVGDMIYSDAGLTTPYNTGSQSDYSINEGSFITLDKGSIVINTTCR